MNFHNIKHISILAVSLVMAALMMMACGTTKHVINGNNNGAVATPFSPKKHFEMVTDNNLKDKTLSAKIKCTIEMDDKSVATSGQLRMKRDEVIQIILLDPILGAMELGRMEFSADRLLVIDRFNKRYIDVPYEDVAFLKKANVNFLTLQHLFWNEIFTPAGMKMELGQFEINENNEHKEDASRKVTMTTKDKMLSYEFLTETTGILKQTTITGKEDQSAKFAFKYDDFKSYQGKYFPNDMTMAFIMGKQNASIRFNLSSLKNKSGWEAKTQIPKKYTKVDAEKIFKSLFNL